MNFLRMFIIVVGVTLCGGAFGGVVGGLLGFAAPNSLEGFFGTRRVGRVGVLFAFFPRVLEMYHDVPRRPAA